MDWWSLVLNFTTRLLRKGTSSVIMLMVDLETSFGEQALVETIKTEAHSWVSAEPRGLAHLLP